jgi:hypothetical protein
MITGIRTTIANALTGAGIENVYTFNPARPIPTCAIIEPDGPFIEVHDDEYAANYTSKWRVTVMVAFGGNEKETANLDDFLENVVPELWDISSVSKLDVDKPFMMELNGATYLSTHINLTIEMQGGN